MVPTAGATVNILGAYTLDFPAGSICDPGAADTQAGYAAAQWDAPCTPATGPISIRATLKYTDGKLYADFTPALRFVPEKTVTLGTGLFRPVVQYFKANGVHLGWSFQYTDGIGGAGVTDALVDPSLRTVVVGSTGQVYRRIKHFSGYFASGEGGYVPCDPNLGNPQCVWYETDPRFGQ